MKDFKRSRRRTDSFIIEIVDDIQKSGLAFGVPDRRLVTEKGSLLHLLASGVLEQRGTGVKPQPLNLVSLVSIAFGETNVVAASLHWCSILGDTACVWLDLK